MIMKLKVEKKVEILKVTPKLKAANIFTDENYTKEVQDQRKIIKGI